MGADNETCAPSEQAAVATIQRGTKSNLTFSMRRAGVDKNHMLRMMLAGGATAGVLASGAAQAVDFNITGFVRQEIAISVTDDENPFNQSGNPFMGRVVPNTLLGQSGARIHPG